MTRVGRYEVITHLATGGMAQIYLARQSGLGSFERHVVLKTILRERANDQRFVTMFLDEAKLAATLNHQNVAQVYEVDQADGAYFMAMEYVHGENARAILETTLRRGWTIPLELAIMIISGAAAGLHHAHERRGKGGAPLNIVHRDVSPANIMVGYDGSVKVLDFGIAKAEERATKTVGGTIKGKYGYMSPEQCKGKPIDRRSDIFALGIVLYELTTLRRAFKGNDDFETMKRIVAGDVVLPSVAVPGYPRELEAIVLTAMANDPNSRFQTGQELIEALDAFAVRAKLTGSNTAMGRFMTQLFGAKKEPWVSSEQGGDRTEISDAGGVSDPDNEKTAIVDPNREIPREAMREDTLPPALRNPAPRTQPMPTAQAGMIQPRSNTTATQPAIADNGAPTAPMRATPAPGDMDQAAWQANDSTHAQRQNARNLVPPHQHAPHMQQQQYPSGPQQVPYGQQMTGPQQALPYAPQTSGQQPFIPNQDISEVGAQPLVDEKLGWSTNVANRLQPGQGSGARLDSEMADYKIRSNKGWIWLAIFLLLGTAGAIAAIVLN
ncbi:MAG TPA: protein kinase [Kofleriaceae bacterium]|jgi:serine/threonine-protein kinase